MRSSWMLKLLLLPGPLRINPRDRIAESPPARSSSLRERQCLRARCRAQSTEDSEGEALSCQGFWFDNNTLSS